MNRQQFFHKTLICCVQLLIYFQKAQVFTQKKTFFLNRFLAFNIAVHRTKRQVPIKPSMHNIPKWSKTLEKASSKYCKIYKMCLTILGQYTLMGYGSSSDVPLMTDAVTEHCVKSVRIQSFSGPHFPYSVQMRENTEQKNSEYGHFLCSRSYFNIV